MDSDQDTTAAGPSHSDSNPVRKNRRRKKQKWIQLDLSAESHEELHQEDKEEEHSMHSSGSRSERSIIHPEDPPATKEKLASIMSRIDDAFDVQEWDASQPSTPSGPNNSPKSLTIKPEPVAYTTVGSRVNPNSTPQFTAPVRIQREGAGRRFPHASIQNRNANNSQPQAHLTYNPSPLNQSAATHWKGTPNLNPQCDIHAQQPNTQYRLTNAEEKVLAQLGVTSQSAEHGGFLGSDRPEVASPFSGQGNIPSSARQHPLPAQKNPGSAYPLIIPGNQAGQYIDPHLHSDSNPLQFGTRPIGPQPQSLEDVMGCRHGNSNVSLSGLEKMQTLQRLSQYPNPVQNIAKGRLSEFAVSKTQITGSDIPGTSVAPYPKIIDHPAAGLEPPVIHQSYTPNNTNSGRNFLLEEEQSEREKFGFPDPRFRFPDPGAQTRAKPYPIPSQFGNDFHDGMSNMDRTDAYVHAARGYPQPLTAGPPGFRGAPPVSYPPGFHSTPPDVQKEISATIGTMVGLSRNAQYIAQHVQTPTDMSESPMIFNHEQPAPSCKRGFRSDGRGEGIRDTLPFAERSKYYPHGFPKDMHAEFQGVDEGSHKVNMGLSTVEQVEREKRDNWFYSSLGRLPMTIEDHLQEQKDREVDRKFGRSSQPPIQRPIPKADEALTADQVQAMTPSEVAGPLLNNAFGTFLSYADGASAPMNPSALSRFVPPPAWCVDSAQQGNATYFGEDWGVPPKRVGRDPRFQDDFGTGNARRWGKSRNPNLY